MAAARQIVTIAAVGSCNLPVVFRFCFDPSGPLPAVCPSAVRRRLHVRRFSIPPSLFPSSERPARASPAPPPSIRTSTSPATIIFPVMELSTGTASCWPWVPWSEEAQDKHRVSHEMGFNVIKDSLLKGAKMKGMCEIFEHSRLQTVMLEGAFELPNGDELGPDALGVHFTNLSLRVKVDVKGMSIMG